MSTTNPSSYFKSFGQWTTRAMEGSLQGVQAEICELERKLEVADGKTQAHYHEWLEELKQDWEATQEELSRMREKGTPSTPKLAMPSPQPTQRWKEAADPTGLGTPRVSLWVALKDLLLRGIRST